MQNCYQKFKQNKRGYYSFILLAIFSFFTFFAEVIANDKPLFIRVGGHSYFPFIQEICEVEIGGIFETEADFRDQKVQQMLDFAIWPPLRFSHDTINYNLHSPAPSRPTSVNLLGTDDNGRDILARIIYGARTSLIFGILLTFFSAVIAIVMGALQGYFGGWMDIFLQRFTEIWSAMPVLFLLIIMSSILEPSFFTLIGLLLLFSWMSLAAYVRAEFLRLKNFEFVMAARALGASDWRIITKHILPNASTVIVSNLPFLLSGAIITITSLDFLGLGMPIGEPSLGELLAQGKNNINAWWLGLSGFMVMSFILVLLIFIGESLRNAFNNKLD